jgi:uridine phosphorylase
MPTRLRPKAPVASDALLVGDPGRSLLLAQTLLEAPRMSNHARGLWGYSGRTAEGRELTIQATGMGGPSAAAVLADLAELGVRRAIRIGTCAGLAGAGDRGELLLVARAIACGGSATSFGLEVGGTTRPDGELLERLSGRLGAEAQKATVASFDSLPTDPSAVPSDAAAVDMQTVAVLARAQALGMAAAATLIVSEEIAVEGRLDDAAVEAAAKRAGQAAAGALST